MKSRLLAIAVASSLLGLSWPAAADGEKPSARELKKIQKQADRAFDAGQVSQAVDLYEQILAATPPGDGLRTEALYAVALTYLAPDPPAGDPEAARPLLDELAASFPSHPRRLEIAAARAWLEDRRAATAEIESAAAELAQVRSELEAQRQQIEAERLELAGESEAADGRVRSLKSQLRQAQGELADVRAELEKKEEALRKLKAALVGRAGGSG